MPNNDNTPDVTGVTRSGPNEFPKDMNLAIDKARTERLPEVRSWDIAARFLRGDQNLTWGTSGDRLVSHMHRPGQNATVTNHMLGVYRTTVALQETHFPDLTVVGASPSWDNITKALAAEEALRYWWHVNKMDMVLARCARWTSVAGNCALHTFYHPGLRRVVTEEVSAYDLLWEARATSRKMASWSACRTIYLRKTLVDAYPKLKDFIMNKPAWKPEDPARMAPDDRLDVWDVYFKDGRHGVLLGDKWLYKEKNPAGMLCLSPMRFTDVPGKIWGLSQMYPLVDMQQQYNRYKNFALDIADLLSNPVWLVPDNAGVSKSQITNEPGAVIVYRGMANPPQRAPAAAVPQHLFEIQGRSLAEMLDVGGIHSPSMGKRASGVTSGIAMQQLKEGDRAQLVDTMRDVEGAFVDAATAALVLWRKYITEKQDIRIFDESIGRVVHKQLAGTDLIEDPEIFVEPGSLYKYSAKDRDELLGQMLQMQVITPEEYRKKVSLRLHDQERMKKMVALSHARDLLNWCKEGGQIEIFPTDDLESIREVFEEYIHSPEYYQLAVRAGQVQAIGLQDQGAAMMGRAQERMHYIRDVLVSVSIPPGSPPEAYQMASQMKIFPLTEPDPSKAINKIMAAQSPVTQGQMTQETMRAQDIGNRVSTARQSFDVSRGTPGVTGVPG
jgi:hypothetical protein